MIKALFWDNDGVLVDTERLYFKANKEILARVGIRLTNEMFVEFFLRQGRGAWHIVEGKGFDRDAIQRMRDERNAIYGELLRQEANAIEGAAETLRTLHETHIMGIVTSSRKDHFAMIHRRTDLLRHVDFVLADGDYARHKPDPDPYLAAVERSGCLPEECVAVEDSERGLLAAKAAALKCLIIPTALTRGGDFSRADKVLRTIREVPSVLLSLSV